MSLNQVHYFIEVARCGSIREASERLNVAASALSRQIQNLEREFGVALFERLPRGMKLSPAGEIYIRYARSVHLETDRVSNEIKELRGLRRGTIRIYAVEGSIADVLTPVISEFRGKHPGISFKLVAIGTDDVVTAVRDGQADVGISFHGQADTAVRFVRRFRDPLRAIVHPKHPLAKRRQLSLAEALDTPMALPQPGFGIRRLIDEQCRRLGLSITPVLETNSIEALRGFARAGAGITMLPTSSIRRDLRQKLVSAVPLSDRPLNQCSMDVSVLGGRRLPATLTEFLGVLEQALMSDTSVGTS
ncbi:MAG: LysR family transcriptional regulator [Pseudolabrys sp.]|nr:LysR family transcriptional regulator [Pseudolabrys sp.]